MFDAFMNFDWLDLGAGVRIALHSNLRQPVGKWGDTTDT
jgi:hypothetical protein